MTDHLEFVFVVGSDEEHFVADRVYKTLEEAKIYCDSMSHETVPWLVMQVPLGGCWLMWKVVHRCKK